MLNSIKEILIIATKNLQQKIKTHPKFIATAHFQERLIQRFQDEDLPRLERTIEKAFLQAECGSKIRYTHPAYGITVVGEKMGLNGFELVTCWQKEEDAE
ncbi:hypothetical protein SAMN06313486_10179 [Epsilonproteobacteria bacterium SCGC AD-308-P11]|jgi:hypothetical protein|nr:hypothetical protein SAMN06313486_10179 [Epsilonproteobacteria bacterium SCGC AD-308-P11]